MAVLLDSYSETNQDSNERVGPENPGDARYEKYAQSFTPGAATLDSCKFTLLKIGTVTGNAVAKLYAHSGTFGTSSVPTGVALATSDNFDVSVVTGSYVLYTFNFSGANRVAMAAATKYCISIEFNNMGDASNFIAAGSDQSSMTHAGNMSRIVSGTWTVGSDGNIDTDLCFYVYGDLAVPLERGRMFFVE